METTDATAIQSAYTQVSTNATISNSMQAVTGMGVAIASGIVLALVMTFIKRITKRVSRGKSGL